MEQVSYSPQMFKDNKTTVNGMKHVMQEMKKEFKKIKSDQT